VTMFCPGVLICHLTSVCKEVSAPARRGEEHISRWRRVKGRASGIPCVISCTLLHRMRTLTQMHSRCSRKHLNTRGLDLLTTDKEIAFSLSVMSKFWMPLVFVVENACLSYTFNMHCLRR
jgi:hypothetical protein